MIKPLSLTPLLLLLCFTAAKPPQEDAKTIIQKAEQILRGAHTYAEMKMTIVRPEYEREITMKTWAEGQNKSLILITAPARDKGTAFLKLDKEVWNWQPRIERVIKLPPSMMMQSWMGSDFTNDDLVKESSTITDYAHAIVGEETIENRTCYKIELIPKPEAAVVWGKVFLWIDKKDYLQLKGEFYDEDGYLVNRMIGKNITTMGGKILPSVMEMIPVEKEGHKTIIEYLSLDFSQKMEADFYSVQNMKRIR